MKHWKHNFVKENIYEKCSKCGVKAFFIEYSLKTICMVYNSQYFKKKDSKLRKSIHPKNYRNSYAKIRWRDVDTELYKYLGPPKKYTSTMTSAVLPLMIKNKIYYINPFTSKKLYKMDCPVSANDCLVKEILK